MRILGKRDGGPEEKYPVRAYVFERARRMAGDAIAKVVVVDRPEKRIVCMPSSIGCARTCCFCSSGGKTFLGRMYADELKRMLEAVIGDMPPRDAPLLVSMMGTGEPMDHMDSVVLFLSGLPAGVRSAIATTVPSLDALHHFMSLLSDTKVLVSLHAGTHEKRRRVLRDNKCLAPAVLFQDLGDHVEYNYVTVRGLNDDPAEARALNLLANGDRMRLKLNALNTWPGCECEPGVFPADLLDFNIEVEEYQTDGATVLGACGQCGV